MIGSGIGGLVTATQLAVKGALYGESIDPDEPAPPPEPPPIVKNRAPQKRLDLLNGEVFYSHKTHSQSEAGTDEDPHTNGLAEEYGELTKSKQTSSTDGEHKTIEHTTPVHTLADPLGRTFLMDPEEDRQSHTARIVIALKESKNNLGMDSRESSSTYPSLVTIWISNA